MESMSSCPSPLAVLAELRIKHQHLFCTLFPGFSTAQPGRLRGSMSQSDTRGLAFFVHERQNCCTWGFRIPPCFFALAFWAASSFGCRPEWLQLRCPCSADTAMQPNWQKPAQGMPGTLWCRSSGGLAHVAKVYACNAGVRIGSPSAWWRGQCKWIFQSSAHWEALSVAVTAWVVWQLCTMLTCKILGRRCHQKQCWWLNPSLLKRVLLFEVIEAVTPCVAHRKKLDKCCQRIV